MTSHPCLFVRGLVIGMIGLSLQWGGYPAHAAEPGLAASFIRDVGIARHPAVLFAEDFESEDCFKRWQDVRNPGGEVLSLVRLEGDGDSMGACLKVESVLGRDTGGGFTQWFASAPRIHVRFYTRFDSQCDYVHHFVTLRANRGLQGKDRWSGFGGAGNLPDGTERFSTALEPWGNWGRFPAPGKWNFYSYWHEMKASPDGKYWGNSFKPDNQPLIPKNQWICAEFMLAHNTPGQSDGSQAFWINGKRMGEWKGISWRKNPELMANALTLESYITDRWTKNATNTVYFDSLVIAREYVGPMQMD